MKEKDNICYIASAGAGKTTWLIESLLARRNVISNHKKIAIVTFTIKNQEVIRNKIIKKHGFIPSNIYVLGWFEFLLKYIINPYKGDIIPFLYMKHIGVQLVNSPSGIIKIGGKYKYKYKKSDIVRKYLTRDKTRIYSDKLSEFAFECISCNKENFYNRINSIFDSIYFDESQDFVGFDYEIIKTLIKKCSIRCIIAADPRQHTFSTHISEKYGKYSGKIDVFLDKNVNTAKKEYIKIDNSFLAKSHRCIKEICELSSKLTPLYPPTVFCECEKCVSRRNEYKGSIGCFLIKKQDVDNYVKLNNPIALTWNKTIKIHNGIKSRINFGESKGWECSSSIIYCTNTMQNWLKDPNYKLPDESRSKLYVAITRARFITALVVDDDFDNSVIDIPFWNSNS